MSKEIPKIFTYDWYRHLIELLIQNGYTNIEYNSSFDKFDKERAFILRHDIDNSISKAIPIAKIEKELNVKSTFFVLLTSDFYNIASKKNIQLLNEIVGLGHGIGLHFDEVSYNDDQKDDIPTLIKRECQIMESILNVPITSVSMHRPSKNTLNANYSISGIINSYGNRFFNEYKYLSDSRCRWREPIIDIIESQKYEKLHILTHPFWYNETQMSIKETLYKFISDASSERYETEKENITDLDSILI